MIGPIRNDLRHEKKHFFRDPVPYGIDLSAAKCSIKVACTPYPQIREKLSKFSPEQLVNYLKFDVPKVLATGSLLLFTDEKRKVSFVGTITKRDVQDMAMVWINHEKLTVCVEFTPDAMKIVLQSLSKLDHPREPVSRLVIQSNVSLFNYIPILERLRGR
jgi:hypothetical protein